MKLSMTALRILAFLLFPAFFLVTHFFKDNIPVLIAAVVTLFISYVLLVKAGKERVKHGEPANN